MGRPIKYFIFSMIVVGVFLTSCDLNVRTAAQIKEEGIAKVNDKIADQTVLDMEKHREFIGELNVIEVQKAAKKEAYRAELWALWKPAVELLGFIAFYGACMVVVSLSLGASRGGYVFAKGVFVSANRFIEIRSGVAPIDRKTRIPLPIIFDAPQIAITPNTSTVLGKVQSTLGLRVKYTPNGQKWTVMNVHTGEIIAKMTENRGPNMSAMEFNRHAILDYIMYAAMAGTAWHKEAGGDVAEAMSRAQVTVPASRIDQGVDENAIQNLKDYILDAVQLAKNEAKAAYNEYKH